MGDVRRLAPRPDRGCGESTKGRYGFVFGDFRRVRCTGIISCHYRAAEWGHKAIELAAHELLQYLDQRVGGSSEGR